MIAVILAAGKGTRLHPLTHSRSKAMLPVMGKPIIERVMEQITANGITHFILVVSPSDDLIVPYFEEQTEIHGEIQFIVQAEPRGMADALRCASPLIEGDFLLSACDNLTSSRHIHELLKGWQDEPPPNAVLSLMPVKPEQVSKTGIVTQDGKWISDIVEKPSQEQAPSNIASLPLYIFNSRIIDFLDKVHLSTRGEYELQDAIRMLIQNHGYVSGVTTNHRLTLTDEADFLMMNMQYLRDFQSIYVSPGTDINNSQLIPPIYIEPGVVIGENCVLGPYVYIENNCRIGKRSSIRESVLLREANLVDNQVIENKVMGE